jgi:hypothetical protein
VGTPAKPIRERTMVFPEMEIADKVQHRQIVDQKKSVA